MAPKDKLMALPLWQIERKERLFVDLYYFNKLYVKIKTQVLSEL